MQGYCQSAALAIWSKVSSSGNFLLVCHGSYGQPSWLAARRPLHIHASVKEQWTICKGSQLL